MIDPFLHTRAEPWPAQAERVTYGRAVRRRKLTRAASLLLLLAIAAAAIMLNSSCSAIGPAVPAGSSPLSPAPGAPPSWVSHRAQNKIC